MCVYQRATLARLLHDMSRANNNREAVVVYFNWALRASVIQKTPEILDFQFFFKFCTIIGYHISIIKIHIVLSFHVSISYGV